MWDRKYQIIVTELKSITKKKIQKYSTELMKRKMDKQTWRQYSTVYLTRATKRKKVFWKLKQFMGPMGQH